MNICLVCIGKKEPRTKTLFLYLGNITSLLKKKSFNSIAKKNDDKILNSLTLNISCCNKVTVRSWSNELLRNI